MQSNCDTLNLVINFALFRLAKRQGTNTVYNSGKKSTKKESSTKNNTIDTNSTDENGNSDMCGTLGKVDCDSYTVVASSSASQSDAYENHQYARQSVLYTLMLHLNSHPPSDISKWDVYQDFGDKLSGSVSPTVYRNFERIIL
jgi:hypothetical protein